MILTHALLRIISSTIFLEQLSFTENYKKLLNLLIEYMNLNFNHLFLINTPLTYLVFLFFLVE